MTPISVATVALFLPVLGAGAPPAHSPAISFQNDVLPVLSKAGCNQGTCHGSAGGRGGFLLSLRGFAPELDHRAIALDLYGRRVDRASPEESLLLRKPSLATPHQGGRVLPRGSGGHRILLEWIRGGAPGPLEGEPRPTGLEVEPGSASLEAGAGVELRVRARFSDGGLRDVTGWARYDSSDAMVAAVDGEGRVRAVGPGLAAVSASYQDQVRAVEVLVPYAPAGGRDYSGDYSGLPRNGAIDEVLIARWKELRLWPSPPAGDAAFLRRIHLDLTGLLPRPEEVKAFLADPRPRKREEAIDRLLESPAFADHWTQKWGDIFRLSREWLGEKAAWQLHRWLRQRIEENAPWDQVVRELVGGAGNSSLEGPPNYHRLQKVFNEPELWPLVAAETTAQTFLGVRMQCARCHNHPFDRWTQGDYYGLVSFFSQVGAKSTPEGQVVIFDSDSGEIPHPRLGRPLPPRPPAGPVLTGNGTSSRRQLLASWITAPENPFFARATANRVWRHFMGRGLVEPLDDIRPSNPATSEALLSTLAGDLTAEMNGSRFDIRHLIRRILVSNAYGLSSAPGGENRADDRFYSRFQPRRMSAEGLFDALGQVTGLRESFAGLPADLRAQQLPDTRTASAFLDGFGRPLRRMASCECERVGSPNLAQALELMHSSALQSRLSADGSLVEGLIRSGAGDPAVIEEIYLRALSRPPSPEERAAVGKEWEETAARAPEEALPGLRREYFEDVLWAAINSREFLFNH